MIIDLAVEGKIQVIPIRLDRVEVPLVLRGYQLVDVGTSIEPFPSSSEGLSAVRRRDG